MIETHKFSPNLTNLVKYHLKKVNDGAADLLDSNIAVLNEEGIINEFKNVQRMNNHTIENWVFHSSINLAKGEVLSDKIFKEVAHDFMQEMGFDDNPFVIIRHTDKPTQDHIHIIAPVYKNNPNEITLNSYSRINANRILTRWEKELNLTPTSTKANANTNGEVIYEKAETRKEIHMSKRDLRPLKMEMKRRIDYAFKTFSRPEHVISYLKRNGVNIQFATNKSGIYGVSFAHSKSNIDHVPPLHQLPQSYLRQQLTTKNKVELIFKNHTQLSNGNQLLRNEKGRVINKRSEKFFNYWKKARENNIAYKGSRLGKEYSWNRIQDVLLKGNLTDQKLVELSDPNRDSMVEQLTLPQRNLLVAFEANYQSGVYELFQKVESIDFLYDLGYNEKSIKGVQKAFLGSKNRFNETQFVNALSPKIDNEEFVRNFNRDGEPGVENIGLEEIQNQTNKVRQLCQLNSLAFDELQEDYIKSVVVASHLITLEKEVPSIVGALKKSIYGQDSLFVEKINSKIVLSEAGKRVGGNNRTSPWLNIFINAIEEFKWKNYIAPSNNDLEILKSILDKQAIETGTSIEKWSTIANVLYRNRPELRPVIYNQLNGWIKNNGKGFGLKSIVKVGLQSLKPIVDFGFNINKLLNAIADMPPPQNELDNNRDDHGNYMGR